MYNNTLVGHNGYIDFLGHFSTNTNLMSSIYNMFTKTMPTNHVFLNIVIIIVVNFISKVYAIRCDMSFKLILELIICTTIKPLKCEVDCS